MTQKQNNLFWRFGSDEGGAMAILGAVFAIVLVVASGLLVQIGMLFRA
jgi:hypothetical protein